MDFTVVAYFFVPSSMKALTTLIKKSSIKLLPIPRAKKKQKKKQYFKLVQNIVTIILLYYMNSCCYPQLIWYIHGHCNWPNNNIWISNLYQTTGHYLINSVPHMSNCKINLGIYLEYYVKYLNVFKTWMGIICSMQSQSLVI